MHFYPRPPRGGRLTWALEQYQQANISIHALREEGDLISALFDPDYIISIHALREEGDV